MLASVSGCRLLSAHCISSRGCSASASSLPASRSCSHGSAIFARDLEIADDDGAGALLHALERIGKRAVGDDVVRHQEEEAGVDHVLADLAHRLGIGERDGGRIIAVGDEMIDRMDRRLADGGELFERRMLDG